MASRRALVTGGNGFVGCHVVRALVVDGATVRTTVREGADMRALHGVDCEIVKGDLRDSAAMEQAARGCDEIHHVAADYRLWLLDEAPMYAANVEGTRNVMAAARKAGASRVVHTSTVGAIGIPYGGVGDERTPVTLGDMVGAYKRSKFMAEQVALQAARDGLPVVIVNPSTPVGPFDFKPTPTGRIIVEFLNRRVPAYVETGLNMVDVSDVARGHLLAASKGVIGERYILGGENLTLAEVFGRLEKLSGLPAPRIKLPYAVAWTYAMAAEAAARVITHKPPRASLTEVRMSRKRMFFDSTKARDVLGYVPGSVDAALSGAIGFFRETGIARPAA